MTKLTIIMPEDLQATIESRISAGGYVDAGDYLRDLVRRDRHADDQRWLKAMIDEGLASGVLDQDAEEVLDAIIAEDPDLRA